jgi:formamidopyrimidine-DNA glycosylase
MPEGPDVASYRDFLLTYLHNNMVIGLKILKGRYTKKPIPGLSDFIKNVPTTVTNINTKGKFMYITFDNGFYLMLTFGLTGGWDIQKNGSERIELLTNKEPLYYIDQRNFGTFNFTKSLDTVNEKLNDIGDDIMDKNTTLDIFKTNIKNKKNLKKQIAIVLLDQKYISGIGNYLRADGLYLAGISPFRKTDDVTDNELSLLYDNLRYLAYLHYDIKEGLKQGIIKHSSSDKNKPDSKKYLLVKYTKKGLYHSEKKPYLIYRQDRDLFGEEIVANEIDKRTIYWVPSRQS